MSDSPNEQFSPAPRPAPAPDPELERVRQIIIGSDPSQSPLRQAEVDRLRQILFAPQMEDYERRFSDQQRAIERMRSDVRSLQDRVHEFEKQQIRRVEQIETAIQRMQADLRRESERQRSRDNLVQQLQTQTRQQELLGTNLGESLNDVRISFDKHEAELASMRSASSTQREHYEQRLEDLKREVRQAEDTMRTELHRIANRLTDQKIDRKALSAMLIEVATRLETGSSLASMLESLSQDNDLR